MEEQLSFHVSGMHCASCAANIERKLKKTQGISSASVNYANEQAAVTYDTNHVHTKTISSIVSSLGYKADFHDSDGKHQDHEHEIERNTLKRLVVISLVVTAILMVGIMFPSTPQILKNPFLVIFLASFVQFVVGKRFYSSALSALKNNTTNMDTLIVLGTSIAYGFSIFSVLGKGVFPSYITTHTYFETSSAIIAFVLLGKYLELRSKDQTKKAIQDLMKLTPQIAHIIHGKEIHDIPTQQVQVGDKLLVKTGESFPVDGVVKKGNTTVNESMVTGESFPVMKQIGDQVIGATINIDGVVEIVAQKVGSDTLLSSIIRMVQEAQGSRASVQRLADTISSYFVPTVLVLSVLTFVVWMIFGPEPKLIYALLSMVSVLIIACPCALGLATPMSLVVGIGKGAKEGILIKDAQSLEQIERIKHIVFDKTGTVTQGRPQVQSMFFIDESKKVQEKILSYILSLELMSHHVLAKAIVEYIQKGNPKLQTLESKSAKDISGLGVVGNIDGKNVVVGTEQLLNQENMRISKEIAQAANALKQEGQTIAYVGVGKEACVVFGIQDALKQESIGVMKDLHEMGIETYLLSGDHKDVVRKVAEKLHIKHMYAQVKPDDKEKMIEKLTKNGKVAMVGDGINDAPALARADVGIAMGNGTDVAIHVSDVTLLRSDISLVPKAFRLSKYTMNNVRQNLFWAFGYNVVLIPVAMGVLYPFFKIQLNPMIASAAMALSSVSVVLNALRLKRVTL